MIIEVAASGYLPHLQFGSIGPIGPHDSRCTLELHLQLHWLSLELIVGYGPGAENNSQLKFGMWLVTLTARVDHAVPRPILTVWLTHLLDFCDEFRG